LFFFKKIPKILLSGTAPTFVSSNEKKAVSANPKGAGSNQTVNFILQ
jgi:hypothetical protein